jgi:hypothetical protein
LGLIIGLTLFVAGQNWGSSFDDAFITYRYAKNMLEGRGFVYNPGERHLGTTSPLFTLLLAFFGLFYPDIPFWGSLLSLLALGGVAAFTYLLLSGRVNYWAGVVSIPLVLLNRALISTIGNESLLLILLLVSQYYFYTTRRLKTFAVLAGLGVLTRGEGALLPAIIFFFECARWRRERKADIIPWLIIIAVAAPWFLFSKSYFGYFLPATLRVKMLASNNPRYAFENSFFDGIVTNFFSRDVDRNFWSNYSFNTFSRIVLAITFLFGLLKSWLDRRFVPLTLSIAAYFIGYSLLNVGLFHWYVAPIAYALSLCLAYAIYSLSGIAQAAPDIMRFPPGNLSEPDGHSPRSASEWIPPLRIFALISLIMVVFTVHPIKFSEFRREIYTKAGSWIRANTSPDATIGLDEIGIVGYYADRRVIDSWGLASPEMGKEETQYDFGYLVGTFRPEYILTQRRKPRQALDIGMQHPRFCDYTLVKIFASPQIKVGIWKRRDVRVQNFLALEDALLPAAHQHLSPVTVDNVRDGGTGNIRQVARDKAGKPSWAMVDFGEDEEITVRFLAARSRRGQPGQSVCPVELFGSLDGLNWERLARIIQKMEPPSGEWCSLTFASDRDWRRYTSWSYLTSVNTAGFITFTP